MKWGNILSVLFVSLLILTSKSCAVNDDICAGQQTVVLAEKDTFFTSFARYDTAFYELTLNGSRKSERAYMINLDTLFTDDLYGCDDFCTEFETEILRLDRVDGKHSFIFSNNQCAKRKMWVNNKEYDFRNKLRIVTKTDSVVLRLDSGLMYYKSTNNYILKRIR